MSINLPINLTHNNKNDPAALLYMYIVRYRHIIAVFVLYII